MLQLSRLCSVPNPPSQENTPQSTGTPTRGCPLGRRRYPPWPLPPCSWQEDAGVQACSLQDGNSRGWACRGEKASIYKACGSLLHPAARAGAAVPPVWSDPVGLSVQGGARLHCLGRPASTANWWIRFSPEADSAAAIATLPRGKGLGRGKGWPTRLGTPAQGAF